MTMYVVVVSTWVVYRTCLLETQITSYSNDIIIKTSKYTKMIIVIMIKTVKISAEHRSSGALVGLTKHK